MSRIWRRFQNTFLSNKLDFRVRLFNVLAMAGIVISFISAAACLINDEGLLPISASLLAAAVAFTLMVLASKTGRYQLCYMLTIVVIFLILFPFIFFVGGGYHGAMPAFFVFATLFTTFMLDGKKAVFMMMLEVAVFIGICVLAYQHPEWVTRLASERAVVTDIIIGFTATGISLGAVMLLHFRLYNSQQRQLEEAREQALRLNQTKTIFLANMSHEIRTPINVILGVNEMILRESDSEQITEYSRNIQQAGKTLLTLISNILDVSKIESGKFEITPEDYRTAELVEELALIGREQAGKHGLTFAVEADETLPSRLVGDFLRVKQVVVNFLSNAVKYTEKGSVKLRFNQKKGDKTGEILLCVSVADTGTGIQPEQLGGLFEKFSRGGHPRSRAIEGTGLGLSIAKELAELMGGTIQVHSTWGAGSVFSVVIPQQVACAAPVRLAAAAEEQAGGHTEGSFLCPEGKILIVDDNEQNLQVIKSLLSRTLLQIDTAQDGAACLRALRQKEYHAILMDYMMPGMDGIETYQALLRENPGFSVPVIALTANAVAGAEQMFLQAGFAAYLTKPIYWRRLEETLRLFLPPPLVIPCNLRDTPDSGPDSVRNLARALSPCGITLEKGLGYLSGDLLSYSKLSAFFLESYPASHREMETLFRQENWQGLQYPAHSLKSRALAVGALPLHNTAEQLEQCCGENDKESISLLMPLLALQWQRACQGLRGLETYFSSFAFAPDGQTPDIKKLLASVRAYRRKDAEQEIERFLAADSANVLWTNVRQAVRELDFEKAEQMILARKEGVSARGQ